jgi:hypothetical protein
MDAVGVYTAQIRLDEHVKQSVLFVFGHLGFA